MNIIGKHIQTDVFIKDSPPRWQLWKLNCKSEGGGLEKGWKYGNSVFTKNMWDCIFIFIFRNQVPWGHQPAFFHFCRAGKTTRGLVWIYWTPYSFLEPLSAYGIDNYIIFWAWSFLPFGSKIACRFHYFGEISKSLIDRDHGSHVSPPPRSPPSPPIRFSTTPSFACWKRLFPLLWRPSFLHCL